MAEQLTVRLYYTYPEITDCFLDNLKIALNAVVKCFGENLSMKTNPDNNQVIIEHYEPTDGEYVLERIARFAMCLQDSEIQAFYPDKIEITYTDTRG